MAFQTVWYFTNIPKKIVDIVEEDLSTFDKNLDESLISNNIIDEKIRKSQNTWIPSNHWIGGFIWHYIERANRENFLYDISGIDGEALQYTVYEKENFYNWHNDEGVQNLYKPRAGSNRDAEGIAQDFVNKNIQYVRKLSVVLQLTDADEYEGGNLELINESNEPYIAPRIRGTVIIFDSRTQHRVMPITKGRRKSLVGWIVGPRWK